MAVARMKKVTVFCHRSRRQDVLATLEQLGSVQIRDARQVLENVDAAYDDEQRRAQIQERLDKVSYVLGYLQKLVPVQRSMLESLLSVKDRVSAEQFAKAQTDTSYLDIYQTCFGDEVRLNEINQRRNVLTSHIHLLTPWTSLSVPIQSIQDTKYSTVKAVTIPTAEFEQASPDLNSLADVKIARQDNKTVSALVVYHNDDAEQVDAILNNCSAKAIQFGDLTGRPRDIIAAAKAELAELSEQEQEIGDRADKFAQNRDQLFIVHDYLSNELKRSELPTNFVGTEYVDVICGWVKSRDVDRLKNELWQHGEIDIQIQDPDSDDQVPVELENHPLVQPFEVVTNLYGFPRYNEVDPTPLLAPFFFIFFGLALTDAGYGILLIALGLFALRKFDLPHGGQKLIKLLMIGGSSTIILGILTGSWFGDLPRFLPGFLASVPEFISSVMLVDPISEPITVLLIALSLGVVQVWTGVLIKMIIVFGQGRPIEAILEHGSWLVFIPGIIMFALAGNELEPIARTIAFAGGFGVVLAGAYRQPNWFLKPFSGLYNLYGLINYVGDVLSYSRLLALGLATAVIGVVVNQIAELVGGVPVIGIGLMAMLMIGGHIFNLLVNTLGSFVHSGRLQFVEFFTKFFEGGGKAFQPYRWEGKYINVQGAVSVTEQTTKTRAVSTNETGGM